MVNSGREKCLGLRRGYTLTELVMVIAIAAILSAIAAPRYAGALTHYRADAAARRVAADIALAQSQARIASKSQSIVYSVSRSTYELSGLTGLAGGSSAYVVNLGSEPYFAQIVSISFGGSATLTFDMFGAPSSGGTIIVQSGSTTKTLSIDGTTGLVSIR